MGLIRTINNGYAEYSVAVGFIHLAELNNLPRNVTTGSIVHVIETGEKYIFDDTKTWCLLNFGCGNEGGTGLKYVVVEELPPIEQASGNTIYMIKNEDHYDCYIKSGGIYVQISNTLPIPENLVTLDDLADYVKKTELTDGSIEDIIVANTISAQEFIEGGQKLENKYLQKAELANGTVNFKNINAENVFISKNVVADKIEAQDGTFDNITINKLLKLAFGASVEGHKWSVSSDGDILCDSLSVDNANGITIANQNIYDYVKEIARQYGGGGGTGDTSNYNDLENKPRINGVELTGNKSSSDLKISVDTSGFVEKQGDTMEGALRTLRSSQEFENDEFVTKEYVDEQIPDTSTFVTTDALDDYVLDTDVQATYFKKAGDRIEGAAGETAIQGRPQGFNGIINVSTGDKPYIKNFDLFGSDNNLLYSKTEIDNMIGAATGLKFKEVDILPDFVDVEAGTIYLLYETDHYIMYVYGDSDWITLGTTSVNLSEYYTKDQIDTKLEDYLPLAGGTMNGNINMDTYTIQNNNYALNLDNGLKTLITGFDTHYSASGFQIQDNYANGGIYVNARSFLYNFADDALQWAASGSGMSMSGVNNFTFNVRSNELFYSSKNSLCSFDVSNNRFSYYSSGLYPNKTFTITTNGLHYSNGNQHIYTDNTGALLTSKTTFTQDNEFITLRYFLEHQGSSSGSGSDDYTNLSNLPKINDIIIYGNKNGHDYNLAHLDDLSDFITIDEANGAYLPLVHGGIINAGASTGSSSVEITENGLTGHANSAEIKPSITGFDIYDGGILLSEKYITKEEITSGNETINVQNITTEEINNVGDIFHINQEGDAWFNELHVAEIYDENGNSLKPVQADWTQTNSSKLDYIKNKPDLSVYQLESEALKQEDLAFYRLISDSYNKQETQNLINANRGKYLVVDTLPAVGQTNVIYLVPVDTSDLTLGYHQWVYNSDESDWIDLGTTTINLDNYYTSIQTDNTFVKKADAQADWNEADTTAVSYIKNKPNVVTRENLTDGSITEIDFGDIDDAETASVQITSTGIVAAGTEEEPVSATGFDDISTENLEVYDTGTFGTGETGLDIDAVGIRSYNEGLIEGFGQIKGKAFIENGVDIARKYVAKENLNVDIDLSMDDFVDNLLNIHFVFEKG